ncbi:MAG: cellulase family glycosylhydrolase [Prevotella sp.]
MNVLSVAYILFAAMTFQGCSDNDNNDSVSTLTVSLNDTEISELNCPIGKSTNMLAINTDGRWKASVPDADTTWLQITPHEAYGWKTNDSTASNVSSYMKVTVTANTMEERSSNITIMADGMQKVIAVNQKGINSYSGDPIESAWEMVDNLKMGYNLGNTLDSNPSGDWWDTTISHSVSDWETAWGQPVTTQKMIDDIYAKGFNIIRVPITWGPHMDSNYQVDESWMNRVEEIVNYVMNEKNCYCIINVMHEDSWLNADNDNYETISTKYKTLWKQIATRFKDYDGRLLFEAFNEIRNGNGDWTAPALGDSAYACINKLLQDFVNTVRNTGSNNEYRNIAITTYAANSSEQAIKSLSVPEDVHYGHIYATIHSYEPYNFCSDNSGINTDGTSYDYNIYTFDDNCKAEVRGVVDRCVDRFNNLGIPFIFGEFGAIDEKKDMNERIKYATYIATLMKQNYTTGLWWMGLYDRNTNKWYEEAIVDALAMILAN